MLTLASFLKVLFPLIAIGISLLFLISQAIRRRVKLKRHSKYEPIPNGTNGTAAPEYRNVPVTLNDSEEEDDEGLTMNGGRLALAKTTTIGSIAQLDKPVAQNTLVIIELLAIGAIDVINIVALVLDVYGSKGLMVTVAGILTWTYILILATLRLTLANTRWRVPRLWNHTASLYSLQWVLSIIIFRSAIIHPRSRIAQVLVITEFALVSLLFGIAVTTRKGNKAVVLEWENDITPSREPLASLFSLATFAWVDAIVWQGYKKTFEQKDVWNLVPQDKAAAVLADYRQLKKTTKLTWHFMRYFRSMLLIQCSFAVFSGLFTFAPTLLLKAILEYIEDPGTAPRNVIWL